MTIGKFEIGKKHVIIAITVVVVIFVAYFIFKKYQETQQLETILAEKEKLNKSLDQDNGKKENDKNLYTYTDSAYQNDADTLKTLFYGYTNADEEKAAEDIIWKCEAPGDFDKLKNAYGKDKDGFTLIARMYYEDLHCSEIKAALKKIGTKIDEEEWRQGAAWAEVNKYAS